MITLRPYQSEAETECFGYWEQHPGSTVLVVKPTGAGKTVLMASITSKYTTPTCMIAHRQELVEQISLALGAFGVKHNIIAPRATVRRISRAHSDKYGKVFIDPSSEKMVAGVDTLIKRNDLHMWAYRVRLVVQDEAHHVVKGNKWGKAQEMFPNANGLHVTATPVRADGKGLGSHASGYVDHMIEKITMCELIEQGWLTDYKLFCPPNSVDFDDIKLSSDGDFNKKQLSVKVKGSTITGDVVDTYIKHAYGKRGVTFAVDIEHAQELAAAYNVKGVRAEVVSGKTNDEIRSKMVKALASGEVLQLVNVDLFGEGFDLPAIECVSMARPTKSYSLFAQQFGRALRILEGKEFAFIFDHVGNTERHGLPDIPRVWSLNDRESRKRGERDPDLVPTRTCTGCMQPYEAFLSVCPTCGTPFTPAERSSPESVAGDLTELDPEKLKELRALAVKNNRSVDQVRSETKYATGNNNIAYAQAKNHEKKLKAQINLQDAMTYWGDVWIQQGADDKEVMKRFYHRFNIDALTAKTLNKNDSDELCKKLIDDLENSDMMVRKFKKRLTR